MTIRSLDRMRSHRRNSDVFGAPWSSNGQRRLFLLIDFKDRRRVADFVRDNQQRFPVRTILFAAVVAVQQATFATNSRDNYSRHQVSATISARAYNSARL